MKVDINNAGTRYTLLESIEYREHFVTVPRGFITDFASIPKILWSIYPPTGYYAHAALLHDYIYSTGGRCVGLFPATRKEADEWFFMQMKTDGVGWRTRWTMYFAVRLFGRSSWKN